MLYLPVRSSQHDPIWRTDYSLRRTALSRRKWESKSVGGSEGEETNETETNEDSGGRTGGAAERGVGESFSISSLSLSHVAQSLSHRCSSADDGSKQQGTRIRIALPVCGGLQKFESMQHSRVDLAEARPRHSMKYWKLRLRSHHHPRLPS